MLSDIIAKSQSFSHAPKGFAKTHPDHETSVSDCTPSVIRGTDSQNVSGQHILGFDWLTASGSISRMEKLERILEHYFPGQLYLSCASHYSHANAKRSELGIEIDWTPSDCLSNLHRGKVLVAIPGEAWHRLTPKNRLRLIADLMVAGFQPSRLDLKIRDYDNLITPLGLREIAQKGTEHGADVTGFRKLSHEDSEIEPGEKFKYGTMKFGKRGNPKFLRVYSAMHNHGVDATDWEIELKDEAAKAAWNQILEKWLETGSVDETFRLIGSIIISSVNFVHRDDKNINRCEQYDFWKAFCKGIEAVKIGIQRVKNGIDGTIKWVNKNTPKARLMCLLHKLGIRVAEIENKGLDAIRKEYKEAIKEASYREIADIELSNHHLSRLREAEERPQADRPFSPISQPAFG